MNEMAVESRLVDNYYAEDVASQAEQGELKAI